MAKFVNLKILFIKSWSGFLACIVFIRLYLKAPENFMGLII